MSNTPHRLVLASAGSGKTYELSTRLLELLFAGIEPERILATTFTRKAAREIGDRVLMRLLDAVERGEARAQLAKDLGDRALSREHCEALLAALVRGLSRLRVSTIDAHFALLARLHATELGLPAVWTIADELEGAEIAGEAIGRALEETEPLERLALLRDLQRGASARGVHKQLLDVFQKGRSVLRESVPEAWDTVAANAPPSEPELAGAIASLAEIPLPPTKKGQEPKLWRDAVDELLTACEQRDWAEIFENGLVKKVAGGEPRYGQWDIDDAWRAAIDVLLRQIAHLASAEIVRENHATRALLERFESRFAAAQRESGRLGFDDLPAALAPRATLDPLAARGLDPAHRLDAAIDHLLLDEFQDTSPVQWRALAPLAEAILRTQDGSRTCFCVGDPKQSIYGWRGADPRLLGALRSHMPAGAIRELSKSWRSSARILDTVHRVFEGIASNEAIAGRGEPELVDAAKRFLETYKRHEPAKADLPGAAFLLEATPREGQTSGDAALELAVERVRAIAADAPHATIGVLVGRNRPIADLIYRLRAAGIRASGDGGNPLVDSACVLAALSLLWLADHPDDELAAFHAATSAFGATAGLASGASDADRRAAAARARVGIAERGLGAYLEGFAPSVAAAGDAWESRRYAQLIDLARAFEPRLGSRPSAFVAHARAQAVEDPSAALVRVMTVHKAKGLEFDAVVLPELGRTVLGRADHFLTRREEPTGPITVVSRPLKQDLVRHHPLLRELRSEQRARRFQEDLCVLYVAMTRAVHRLDMIVPPLPKKDSESLSFANVLRAALAPAGKGPGLWRHPDGDARWWNGRAKAAEPTPEPAAPQLALAPSRGAHSARGRNASAAAHAGRVRASSLLAPRSEGTARGTLIHRWFAEVEWIEGFDASEESLLAIGRELESDEKFVRAALAEFRAALAKPNVRALLARRAGEVWRERPFALLLPDASGVEELWTGAFDRVVLARENGRVTAAELIDFKSDRVEGAALAERAASYRPQLAAYRRILARMTGLEERAIRARIAFLAADAIVDVPD